MEAKVTPKGGDAPVRWERRLTHAGMWSGVLGRGKRLRLTDLTGGANVGMLLYHADLPVERYNMPDTLKGQHLFRVAAPYCLHSDMGRILASIVSDSLGWHDTVCGCSDAALVAERYGARSYQEARNEFHRNARECFLIELAKWGLGERDLVPNLNFFSKVVADADGGLSLCRDHSHAGDHVELRFELDTLVVLNTCPHPLDPGPEWRPAEVLLEVREGDPPGPEDPCRNSRPENVRAFLNTETYHLLRS